MKNRNHNLRYPVFPSMLLNYLLLNAWLIRNKNMESFKGDLTSDVSFIFLLIFILFNVIILGFTILKKINIQSGPAPYIVLFLVFQFLNIRYIEPAYYWNLIPDSSTYTNLGLTLFECGKLALDCDRLSILQWPIGQPVISAFLYTYFYYESKYIYLLIFSLAIFFISKLAQNQFGNIYQVGLVYFILLSNNYELSFLIISEIPYLFFSSIFLYCLFKNKYKLSFVFAILSILIRPIGVINLSVFFLFLLINERNKTKFYFFGFTVISLLYMLYNYIMNGLFAFATIVSVNLSGDGLIKSNSLIENLVFFVSKDGFRFISDNLSRLYGSGSRDCVFENCFIFNPLFNKEGSVPEIIFSNEILTYVLRPILELVFKITSPTSLFIYFPFLLLLIFFSNKKNSFVFISIFTLNILLSVLTAEYGSRWWLYPNLLLIYLIPEFLKNAISKIRND